MTELKQELCLVCKKIETFRKCSECENIPLCVICEINHEHKPINQIMTNVDNVIHRYDLKNW